MIIYLIIVIKKNKYIHCKIFSDYIHTWTIFPSELARTLWRMWPCRFRSTELWVLWWLVQWSAAGPRPIQWRRPQSGWPLPASDCPVTVAEKRLYRTLGIRNISVLLFIAFIALHGQNCIRLTCNSTAGMQLNRTELNVYMSRYCSQQAVAY